MSYIRVIGKKKNQIQNPWLDFEGRGPYTTVLYAIDNFSNNPVINNLEKEFSNKDQAISFAKDKFNELKKKHDKGYYITVSVYDNNRNLIKYFKQ